MSKIKIGGGAAIMAEGEIFCFLFLYFAAILRKWTANFQTEMIQEI